MLAQKKMLNAADLESQMAVELPNRDLMQIVIIATNLITLRQIEITVQDINVCAQVVAALLTTGIFRIDQDCPS